MGRVSAMVRIAAALIFAWVTPAFAAPIYLAGDTAAGFWIVDTDTGDRQLIELDDYPDIILTGDLALESPGALLFEVSTAIQRKAIHRVALPGFATTPVSGNCPGDDTSVIGDGPPLEPFLSGLLVRGDELLALHASGDVRAVDLATGDRRIVSRSASPAVGEGVVVTDPLDLALLSSKELVVSDRFETLVAINLNNGDRALVATPTTYPESPQRIDTLPDGRILHCIEGGGAAIWVLDLASPESHVLSSAVYGIGEGPGFVALVDILVSDQGRLFAFDVGLDAVLEIDPVSGDRTIISGGPGNVGTGPELPTVLDHPLFATRPGVWPGAAAGLSLH